ncbi:type II RES/Xre toxin-antitoxin system antitoxin [Zobellia alginiliquefaciens]|uniref:type II RES/Xre toxin-antitoxin system antitoxin n=1 Tax=Zobellia alginiliquefaciens TaxID=3032586 RepID=UPI0023E42523|nr:antitoxin Xre/MbcA/ParS toxin-binding domain-containing protein [Zobellia alginiliquefaciens]
MTIKRKDKSDATSKVPSISEWLDMVKKYDYSESEATAMLVQPKVTFKNVKKEIAYVSFDWNDDSRGYELVSVIREGINYSTFQVVAKRAPLVEADWAVILDTTTRTLDRYKKDNKTFSPTQTEKIIEIQQLMLFGEQVFGSTTNFNAWLIRENIGLGGVIPKNLLDTSVGFGMVKDAIGRIEHGIFA